MNPNDPFSHLRHLSDSKNDKLAMVATWVSLGATALMGGMMLYKEAKHLLYEEGKRQDRRAVEELTRRIEKLEGRGR